MSLQATFDSLFAQPAPLVGLDDLVWQSLTAGSRSSRHPWNLGCLTTVAASTVGSLATRSVVLRRADVATRTIDCHTDRRSLKFDQIHSFNGAAPVAWMFYEPSTKVQLRVHGSAAIMEAGPEWEQAWADTSLRSRSAYVSIATPGSAVDSDRPPDVRDRDVDEQESQRGRDHFVILRTKVGQVDWLYLRRNGHVRARIQYDESAVSEVTWLIP